MALFITRMKALCLVCLALPFFNTLHAQEAVSVGKGSYAAFPPKHEDFENRDGKDTDVGKITKVLEKELFVGGDMVGQPVPTNQWWTDLIMSRYAGDLWAMPLMVNAEADRVSVYQPRDWNADGTHMEKGPALQLRARKQDAPNDTAVVLADFEAEKFPDGWKATGDAFKNGPSAGTAPGQTPVSKYQGARLANSFNGGDGPTGTLTSPAFTVDRAYLHFLVGGGNHPGESEVRLLIDGKTVLATTGENSETLQWRTWDLCPFQGKRATLEIVDGSTGGWGHIMADQFTLSDAPEPERSGDYWTAADARALRHGDWTLAFAWSQASGDGAEVTLARGQPFVWMRFRGIEPLLQGDGPAEVTPLPGTPGAYFVKASGRTWGLYLPKDFTAKASGADITFDGKGSPGWLVLAAAPTAEIAAKFAPYALRRPTGSRIAWDYDPAAAEVRTTWHIDTEPLPGGVAGPVLQGFIPHHYRGTQHALPFIEGLTWPTPRGELRLARGNDFTIGFPFQGFLPVVPAPLPEPGAEPAFNKARMETYCADYAADAKYGGDTYWGGKDLVRMARYMGMARQLGSTLVADKLQTKLRAALADWFTYTDGEVEHYFARYPQWGALVGFNDSYWSFQFTDQHFHYGYFTLSAALLGLDDPAFLKDFGGMATLVAREYANPRRDDPEFPFMRTFDVWEGHSWAGGFSSPGGNNQESSSEAMQAWAGVFLLGLALDDAELRDAGALGFAMERAAVMQYWQNIDAWRDGPAASNFPAAYAHTIAGIVFGNGQAYATYFSGDPAWIYGIQWLPIGPQLDYLAQDPAFARAQWDAMMADRVEKEGAKAPVAESGGALGNVLLGYQTLYDPASVARQMEVLWSEQNPIARDNYTGGITYYYAHAFRSLGPRQWDIYADLPSAAAYAKDGQTTYAAYNPGPAPRTVTFYRKANGNDGDSDKGKDKIPLGQLTAAPHRLTTAPTLEPVE